MYYLLTPWCRVLLEKLTGFAANQEIPRILWNPKFHYRTHKRPPPVPILPTSWRSILILSFHLRLALLNGLFPLYLAKTCRGMWQILSQCNFCRRASSGNFEYPAWLTQLIWHRGATISFLLQRFTLAAKNFQVIMKWRQLRYSCLILQDPHCCQQGIERLVPLYDKWQKGFVWGGDYVDK